MRIAQPHRTDGLLLECGSLRNEKLDDQPVTTTDSQGLNGCTVALNIALEGSQIV